MDEPLTQDGTEAEGMTADRAAPAGTLTAEAGQPASPRAEFWSGARAMSAFMIAAFPLGIIAGAAGIAGGMGWLGTAGMAAAVNSATAMLAGQQLLRHGVGWPVILLTTLVLGLRMMIYATILRPQLRDMPKRWRVFLAFGLVDAVFFIVVEKFKKVTDIRARQWYFLGSVTAMFANWMTSLVVGMTLGSLVPGIAHQGLDFPMTALFIAMMAGSLVNWKVWTAVLAAGALALAANPLPYNLGLAVAALGGAAVGAGCELWEKKREKTAEVA